MNIVDFDNTRSFRESREVLAIERGEWRRGDDKLFTARVSTGVILAALSPSTGQGIIGNFCKLTDPSPQASDSGIFDRCLTEIQIMDMYDAKVWVGGASNTIIQAGRRKWSKTDDDRKFVEDQLAAHSLDYEVNWAPDNMVTYAHLQPAAGRLAVSQFALSYLQ